MIQTVIMTMLSVSVNNKSNQFNNEKQSNNFHDFDQHFNFDDYKIIEGASIITKNNINNN